MRALVLLGAPALVAGCQMARSGAAVPDDATHRRARELAGSLPDPLSTENNAFQHASIMLPHGFLSKKLLVDQMTNLAASYSEDICYWTFQPLPPPGGAPEVQSGKLDQDIEWVNGYGDVAVARLSSMVKKSGNTTVVSAMCAIGTELAKRRCANGKAPAAKCVPGITGGKLRWPMAISLWRVNPDLAATMAQWRNSDSFHEPNMAWMYQGGRPGQGPWNAGGSSDDHPGDSNPPGMPQHPADGPAGQWPVSEYAGWGSGGVPMMGKVVPCAQIPKKFQQSYPVDYVADGAAMSMAEEAYASWVSLCSLYPTNGAKKCGAAPAPPPAPPAPAPPVTGHVCGVCQHVYDAAQDGGGKAFDSLPASWVCPVCGAPKSSYKKAGAQWVHE